VTGDSASGFLLLFIGAVPAMVYAYYIKNPQYDDADYLKTVTTALVRSTLLGRASQEDTQAVELAKEKARDRYETRLTGRNPKERPTVIEKPRGECDSKWWGLLLCGIFFLGLAYYDYIDLTALENEGGKRKIIWILALLYKAFGKFGVVIPFSAVGIGFIGAGILKLVSGPAGSETKFDREIRHIQSSIHDAQGDQAGEVSPAKAVTEQMPTAVDTQAATGSQVMKTENEIEPPSSVRQTDDAPICPACNRNMRKGRATCGPQAGKMFWVCCAFPDCKSVISATD
jgi:hypothetical protein